ncbi:MAG: stalk domain-containing protein [Oscillospiraceae bacterium]
MARIHKLWKAVGGPGTPPAADKRAVKARVNAALDADRKERRIYVRQKLRIVLVTAAVAAAVTGSALAVTKNWDMIQVFFKGDTAPAREYVDSTARSVSDENYTLTVESSMADGNNTIYLIATLTANNEETREFLFSDDFDWTRKAIDLRSAEQAETFSYGYSARLGEMEAPDENSRRFHLRVRFDPSEPVSALFVSSKYMDREAEVEVPVTPAPSVTVEVNASGAGTPYSGSSAPAALTIERVTLSPFTCRIECAHVPLSGGCKVAPRVFFRMADGSIRTQSQMMNSMSIDDIDSYENADRLPYGSRYFGYEFDEIQDLDNIVSVIAFDVEYPLDGSAPIPLDHDPALDPFSLPAREPLAEMYGYSFSVRELTEKLGGTCERDPATGAMTCVYRGVTVVLRPGDITASVDGQPVTMLAAPAVQDGSLAASAFLFEDAWGIECTLLSAAGEDSEAYEWCIVP